MTQPPRKLIIMVGSNRVEIPLYDAQRTEQLKLEQLKARAKPLDLDKGIALGRLAQLIERALLRS